jgi:DNA-directed RNA polymerase specialized sigma24 family protein
MSSGVNPSHALKPFREDESLVRDCLQGSGEAWSDLIDKYRNLIFSIAIKYGFSRDDSSEIFQAVCLTLLQELSRLREPRALAAWLIKLTAHKCLRWRHEDRAFIDGNIDRAGFTDAKKLPEGLLEELEREQIL